MQHRIRTFVREDPHRVVALLTCGHTAPIPPDLPEPWTRWSRSEHGRQCLVGSIMECPTCTARGGAPSGEPRREVDRSDYWDAAQASPAPIALDERLSVARVHTVHDLEELADRGYASVLTLDLAGEPFQGMEPLFEDTWAHALALEPLWLQVDPAGITDADVERFLALVAEAPAPVCVHATGDRRAHVLGAIWLGLRRGLDGEAALRAAEEQGLVLDAAAADLLLRTLARRAELETSDARLHASESPTRRRKDLALLDELVPRDDRAAPSRRLPDPTAPTAPAAAAPRGR